VAIRLNDLAGLLRATNRLPEAEPLMRRALLILEASLPENHPSVETVRQNLKTLLAELQGAGLGTMPSAAPGAVSSGKRGLFARFYGRQGGG
jgi:hypothetical protein